MKKLYFTVSAIIAAGFVPSTMSAQSATDAYQVSQYDLKGTARFMSMAGAFGALGGDLSTLSQNPAGIGVYRSNELGFTLNLDAQQSTAKSMGVSNTDNQTKFYLNTSEAWPPSGSTVRPYPTSISDSPTIKPRHLTADTPEEFPL